MRKTAWDLVVVGFSFGGQGALQLIKAISEIRPNVGVLVFSTHLEHAYARRSFKA